MSQVQLAEAVAVDKARVSEYENGRKIVSAEMANDLAAGLGVHPLAALVAAEYVPGFSAEEVEAVTLFAGLTGERRELARSMLRHLWEREQSR